MIIGFSGNYFPLRISAGLLFVGQSSLFTVTDGPDTGSIGLGKLDGVMSGWGLTLFILKRGRV